MGCQANSPSAHFHPSILKGIVIATGKNNNDISSRTKFRHREVRSDLLPQKQVNRLAGDCFAKLRKAHNNDTFARTKFRHREVRTRLRHREVRSDLLRKNSLMNFKVNFFDRLRKARNNATFSRTKFRHR
ncbi:MAG: hypothetical protein H0X70_08390 [Segetibacter sp.]|nr:hypothetical protein [Segetibacter sp.]